MSSKPGSSERAVSRSGVGAAEPPPSRSAIEAQLRTDNATLLQKVARRFLARVHIHKVVNSRFEKIWDPRRRLHYYYDSLQDVSSWAKPRLLKHYDLKDVAPTYTRDEAATMIQRQLLRRVALRRVRMLYPGLVVATYDESSDASYYFNPRTEYTAWELPKFMGGKLTWEYDKLPRTVRWGPEGRIPNSDDESSDDDSSVDSATQRRRRQEKRKFPRSKAQLLIDAVEDNFLQVKTLNLSNVGSSRISSRLYDMTNLTQLSLAHNQLGPRLSSNIQYLIRLQSLDLSHNNFERLPKQLEELVVIRELKATHNLLHAGSITGYFFKLSTLQLLDLSHNLFKDIPVETGNMELFKATKQWEVGLQCLQKQLIILRLSHNLFAQWPTQLDKLNKIKELDLSYNQLSVVPTLVKYNSSLTRLDLSFNRISSIPSELYQCFSLQRLFLQNNQLEQLPGRLGDGISQRLTEFVELDISHNLLKGLDDRLALFSSMKVLKANDNLIEEMSEGGIAGATNLQHLDLSRNQLYQLPEKFSNCKNLQHLNLEQNHLAAVPMSMSTMRNLTHLYMRDNDISDAPHQVFGMTVSMRHIDLSHNRLARLPMTWFTMSKLAYMDVSFNSIEGPMPRGLGQLKELETLLLRENLITELPESISNLEKLRILELESNQLAGELPAGLSRLQLLWRFTARGNLLSMSPGANLAHCALLKNWDLSWNQRIIGQFIDWREREVKFWDEGGWRDRFVETKVLQRLIKRAWALLGHERGDAGEVMILACAGTATGKAVVDAVEVAAAASAFSDPSQPAKSSKKKGKKNKSMRAQEKLQRKQTLNQILTWHNALKAHFRALLSIYRPTSKVGSGAMRRKVGGGGREEGISQSLSKLASETHLANEQRRTRTRLLTLFRSMNLTSRTRFKDPCMVADLDDDASSAADAKIVESLDLGARFQEPIDLFVRAAREICACATLKYAASINSNASPLIKGEAAELAAEHTPAPLFYPLLSHLTDNELHDMAFGAYLGLATALLQRIECFSLAVRDVERRGAISVSLLNVAHRSGDDLEDLAADDFQEVMDRMTAAEEAKKSGLVEKKKQRMAELIAKSGGAKEVDLDDEDDEEAKKAKREAKKKIEMAQIEKERLQKRKEREDKERKGGGGEGMDEEKEREHEEEEAERAAEEAKKKASLPHNTAQNVARFLFEHRKVTIVWAHHAIDAAAELLSMRGWDPANSGGIESFRSRLERGSEHLAADAIRLQHVKARVLQLSDRYKDALHEYSALAVLAKGKFFRSVAVERIKLLLADTQYHAAREELVRFITDEVPDADRRFPETYELIKTDRRLAMLLMLANAGIDQMARGGVWAPARTITYRILENGLVVKPNPLKESELRRVQVPGAEEKLAGAMQHELQEEARRQREAEVAAEKARLDNLRTRFQVVLDSSVADMERIAAANAVKDAEAAAAIAAAASTSKPGRGGGAGRGAAAGRGGSGPGRGSSTGTAAATAASAGGRGAAAGRGRGRGEADGGRGARGGRGRGGGGQGGAASRSNSPGRSPSPRKK